MLGEYDAGYEGYIDALIREAEELQFENEKLRELVTNLFRATHPADREQLLINAAELGVEVD